MAQLVTRMCIIVTIAFLITRLHAFRQMIHHRLNLRGTLFMMTVFGLFGVLGNYTGIIVKPDATIMEVPWSSQLQSFSAIADTRNIGVIIGGLFGGPIVGIGSGLLAGIHRYFLGGFINSAVLITTILGGLAAGLIAIKLPKETIIRPRITVGVGFVILTIQILLVPVFAVQHEQAFRLIQFTGLPIIFVNSIGIWICAMILYSVIREEERTRATQTQRALFIADQTLPFFRQGLNTFSAKKVADIIYRLTNVDFTTITNESEVLAYIGKDEHSYKMIKRFEAEATKKVILTREVLIIPLHKKIYTNNGKCLFKVAIILPLIVKGTPVGTLILYYIDPHKLNSVEKELAEGLAKLLSTQLELGEVERYNSLLQDAKLKALQAQIQPHFLFNSLNIIGALCRTKPMLAKDLLVHLGTFLRSNLTGATKTLVTVRKELDNVCAYMSLVQARFPNRYELYLSMDKNLEEALLPPFVLQPLVENSIQHGFTKQHKQGTINIIIKQEENHLNIEVNDNGVGMSIEKRNKLNRSKEVLEDDSVALTNIRERLLALFGPIGVISVESQPNCGTRVKIKMPLQFEKQKNAEVL